MLAKDAGAHAVKFQLFNELELYGPDPGVTRRQYPPLARLAEACEALDLDFMCSAFSPGGVATVDPYVRIHKIASAEMMDPAILDAAKRSGKALIVSTGGHTMEEVHRTLDYLGPAHARTTLLYCEAAYPATKTMPEKLGLLQRESGVPVGLSDHSREVYLTAWLAQHYDIPVLEKHVNLVGADGPDAPHSLDFNEFKDMCSYMQDRTMIVRDIISDDEVDMVVQHNRRLVLTCDVPQGATLVKGVNFGSYRGTYEEAHALNPFDWELCNGKVAVRDMKKLECICEGDFE
jgi:N-acetylneuraminate synthase